MRRLGGHPSANIGPAAGDYGFKLKVAARDMSQLRSRVATLAAREATREPARPEPSATGYNLVVIKFRDGRTATFSGKWGQRFDSEPVQAIWDIVSRYPVGAW